MRILFVTPHPPSPIRVRPFQFMRALQDRGHDVTVATPISGPREASDADALSLAGFPVIARTVGRAEQALSIGLGLLRGDPLQAWGNWDRGLQSDIATAWASGAFDVVHVEHLRGSRYGLQLDDAVPIVWDSVDCISHLFRQTKAITRAVRGRAMAAIELGRTEPYEAWLTEVFDHVIVTSEVDREALLDLREAGLADRVPEAKAASLRTGRLGRLGRFARSSAGRRRHLDRPVEIAVVPNIVDVEYWSHTDALRAREGFDQGNLEHGHLAQGNPQQGNLTQGRRPQPASSTVLLTGKLSYHANVTAALYLVERVMPLVWEALPECRLVLAGAQPDTTITQAADRAPGPCVITGYVPDLREWFAAATVAAAPVRYGAGVQNKVLEALASGTPAVVSSLAARPLGLSSGIEALVADSPEEFAAGLVRVISDTRLGRALADAGRRHVAEHFGPAAVAPLLETGYRAAMDRAAAKGRR